MIITGLVADWITFSATLPSNHRCTPLRPGGRALGGPMSWSEPLGLAPLPAKGPLAGLRPDHDIEIKITGLVTGQEPQKAIVNGKIVGEGDWVLTIRDEKVYGNATAHLNVMKAFVDGAAQYADQIRIQTDHADGINRFPIYRQIENTKSKLSNFSVPNDLMDKINTALDHQEEALSQKRAGPNWDSHRKKYLRSAISGFQHALRDFDLREDITTHREELEYYLKMELALCHYHLGKTMNGDNAFAEALKIYREMEKKHPARAVIPYRLAVVAGSMNSRADSDISIKKMQKAIEMLTADESLPRDHWLHTSAPRMLGYYFWKKSEQIQMAMPSDDTDDKASNMSSSLLVKAINVSFDAYRKSKENSPANNNLEENSHDISILANNILYYVVDYLNQTDPDKGIGELGLSDDIYEELVKDITSDTGLTGQRKLDSLDTLVRYFMHTNQQPTAKKYATELQSALEEQGILAEDQLTGSENNVMLEYVKEVLEK